MQFSAARLARASFVFAFAIASIGVASKAQQSEVPPPPDPGVSGSDTYVATWEDIQEERSKAFATLGIAPQQQALRAQVRNSARKLVQNNLTATRSAEIPDLFIDEIAQLLLSIGYGPGDLPKSQGDATSTILSAQNVVSGNPTFDDYLALSKDVVVATVKSISAAQDADDGMNLTVTFTVDKVAKGNISCFCLRRGTTTSLLGVLEGAHRGPVRSLVKFFNPTGLKVTDCLALGRANRSRRKQYLLFS